jgi:type I restriction enzyme M protein
LALDTEWEAADSRDLRTDKHFTLKENPLKRSDLDDFVACYNPKESTRAKSI